MRKSLTLGFALLIALAVPATAMAGFCARMPCCFTFSEASAGTEIGRPSTDCCNSVSCAENPPQKLMTPQGAKFVQTLAVLPSAVPAITRTNALSARVFETDSPPKTVHQRLAALSVFLI